MSIYDTLLWNNPFNLYAFTEKPTKESIAAQIFWQAPPFWVMA